MCFGILQADPLGVVALVCEHSYQLISSTEFADMKNIIKLTWIEPMQNRFNFEDYKWF